MPGCVLRISGKHLDISKVLADNAFRPRPYRTHQAGDIMLGHKGKRHEDAGFCVMASKEAEGQISQQVPEVLEFLLAHAEAIRRISGIDSATLDFGGWSRIGPTEEGRMVLTQVEHFPADLLKLCGELGIALEVSLHPQFPVGAPSQSSGAAE